MCAAKLSIPKQEIGCELGINQTPEALKLWLDSLPVADVEKSTLMALRLLMAANRCGLDVTFHLHLMRSLVPLVDHLVSALRAKYSTGESPYSSERNIKRIEAVKTLLHEMGHGFKIAITKLYGSADPADRPHLSYCIFHAARINACRLIDTYLLYEPILSEIWGELSLLYRFAVKQGIHQDRYTFRFIESSTEQVYMQLLLLAAINPYRLMRGEAQKVYNLMGQWSHHAKLVSPPEDWQPDTSELVVNINSGEPPYLVAAGSQLDNASELRIVNVSVVKKYLDEQAKLNVAKGDDKRHPTKDLNLRLQQDMMRRLIEGWRSDVDRTNQRHVQAEEMELALGIQNSHSLFAARPSSFDDLSLDDFGLVPLESQWGNAPRPQTGPPGSVFKIDDPHRDIWQDKNTKVGSDDIENEDSEPLLEVYPAKQIDVSGGGFCVEFDLNSQLLAKVGDLACVRRAVDEAPWRLCDVRWQRSISNTMGSMGLRLLSERPLALYCKALGGQGSGGSEQLALLICGEDLCDSEAQLLLPASIYDVGTMLSVKEANKNSNVVLTEKLETTSSFSRFKFRLR